MQAKLDKIRNNEDKDQKKIQYSKLLNELMATEDSRNLKGFIQHIVDQNAIVARPIVQELVEKYGEKRKQGTGSTLLPVFEEAIELLVQVSTMAFEEQINNLRYHVAKVYQKEIAQTYNEDDDGKSPYVKAAIHLGKINLEREESQGRTPQEKVKIWLDCARLYIAENLYREAETFLNKCSGFINSKAIKETHKLRYWSCMASCQDYNQKFHQAATGYYRLAEKIPEEDTRVEKLSRGIKCVVLTPAGPARERLLAKYYRDERSSQLPGYSFLEALYVGRFVTKKEIEAFQETLEEHQLKKTKEGWTILEKASIEHNLIAAAKVYNNIKLDVLGHVLGVSAEKGEEIAANMIAEGRLQGSIDQGGSLLIFTSAEANVLTQWDSHIETACNSVNSIVDKLTCRYPDWMAKQF
eukprot:TRINITY_DN889_c0_g1_i1.p1 TRINITY_DN889_c0_g1~~TRINITY_DN889_c0_g1_i1.p1  ORF type:complete len:411 (+),score=87.47 TRINITY_DN889_c0_g1_i1:76-1308(+)